MSVNVVLLPLVPVTPTICAGQRRKNSPISVSTGMPRCTARWIVADADRTRQFYICGVGDGVIQLRDLLRGSGYERRAVHYERW